MSYGPNSKWPLKSKMATRKLNCHISALMPLSHWGDFLVPLKLNGKVQKSWQCCTSTSARNDGGRGNILVGQWNISVGNSGRVLGHQLWCIFSLGLWKQFLLVASLPSEISSLWVKYFTGQVEISTGPYTYFAGQQYKIGWLPMPPLAQLKSAGQPTGQQWPTNLAIKLPTISPLTILTMYHVQYSMSQCHWPWSLINVYEQLPEEDIMMRW